MNVNELKKSSFLKKEDVGDGTVCTIASVEQINVATEGAPEELKWCLHVEEFDKPMVLNSTNGQAIAKITGSEESDEWTGAKVVLYNDPNVGFAGKITGGIRIRAVAKAATAAVARASKGAAPAPANPKAALKAAIKGHKLFGKDFSADDVNGYLIQQYGVKLDELNPAQATEAFNGMDAMIDSLTNIPF